MKLKTKLKELDEKIAKWEQICFDYPSASNYQDTLAKLKTERDNTANKIGTTKR